MGSGGSGEWKRLDVSAMDICVVCAAQSELKRGKKERWDKKDRKEGRQARWKKKD